MYQLWTVDEYNQGSIIGSSKDIKTLIKTAKESVTRDNIDNALTADEKERNWDSMFIELIDTDTEDLIDNAVFSGKDSAGRYIVLSIDDGSVVRLADCECKIKVYIGSMNGKGMYAKEPSGKFVNSIESRSLLGKLYYFIRKA